MTAVDLRVLTLSLQISGQLKTFSSPMAIVSQGKKCANPLENEIIAAVYNLTKADTDYLLTACSPFNPDKTPKIATLSAGRQSIGVTTIFQGNISTCDPTQPPDIGLKFKCQAGQYTKGNLVASKQAASTPLSKIAQQVAGDCGLTCNFQATDKNVANYSFTGGALNQLGKLHEMGGVSAWVDGDQLYVTDDDTPLSGVLEVIDVNSGMVGIPEIIEQGVRVKYLMSPQSKVGGALQIASQIWPAINGTYKIFALGWDVASRDDPFYWIADCKRINAAGQVVVPSGVKKKKGKRK